MLFQQIKKEKVSNFFRKNKKRKLKRFYLFTLNSTFYSTSFKYKFLKYFLVRQSINLNRKEIHSLLKEELGFVFSLNN